MRYSVTALCHLFVRSLSFGGETVQDQDCILFLQWCLPRLGLRWPGYRKVRRTLCKRLGRRLRLLDLPDVAAYRRFLAAHPEEWDVLDAFCRIPISRFYRDRAVFTALGRCVLPVLAGTLRKRGGTEVKCWSAGCASGEEAYSLKITWEQMVQPRFPDMTINILGTDADSTLLERARNACYQAGSLKDLPRAWLATAFDRDNGLYCLRPQIRAGIIFERQDIRERLPEGPFDLILCRNLVFTYFDAALQERLFDALSLRLDEGGYLVVGAHEALPGKGAGFAPLAAGLPIYRRTGHRD